ncbi:hypothetical protein D3C72_2278300 [compost metagenome]
MHRIVVHGHHHHPGAGGAQQDVAQCLQAGAAGQRQVHQDHIGAVLDGQLQRLFGVAGFCGDVHVGKALEQATEAGADQGVIVDDENAHRQAGKM